MGKRVRAEPNMMAAWRAEKPRDRVDKMEMRVGVRPNRLKRCLFASGIAIEQCLAAFPLGGPVLWPSMSRESPMPAEHHGAALLRSSFDVPAR